MSDDQLYSYDYKDKQTEELTRTTSESTWSPLKSASLRVKILLIIFNVICFIAFALYITFIALMIRFDGWFWIYILDILICLCILITMVFGILSVTLCIVPTVRLVIAIIYFVAIIVTCGVAIVSRIVIPSSLSYNPASVGNQGAAIAMVIVIACLVACCGIPCAICAFCQIGFSFGLFREMKELPSGFVADGMVKIYMLGFDWIEDNTIRKCKKK